MSSFTSQQKAQIAAILGTTEDVKKDAAVTRRRRTRKANRQAAEAGFSNAPLTKEECDTILAGWRHTLRTKGENFLHGGAAVSLRAIDAGVNLATEDVVRFGASKQDCAAFGKVRLVKAQAAPAPAAATEVAPF